MLPWNKDGRKIVWGIDGSPNESVTRWSTKNMDKSRYQYSCTDIKLKQKATTFETYIQRQGTTNNMMRHLATK